MHCNVRKGVRKQTGLTPDENISECLTVCLCGPCAMVRSARSPPSKVPSHPVKSTSRRPPRPAVLPALASTAVPRGPCNPRRLRQVGACRADTTKRPSPFLLRSAKR